MSIDISSILAQIPKMDDAALKRLTENVDAWLASGNANKIEAAAKVGEEVQSERARRAALSEQEHAALMAELEDADLATRVLVAFDRVPPTATDIKVISALLRNPGSSSSELSEYLGWGGQIWHTHFGLMCFTREVWLGKPPDSLIRKGVFYSGLLADLDTTNNTWSAKPEIADELSRIAGITP